MNRRERELMERKREDMRRLAMMRELYSFISKAVEKINWDLPRDDTQRDRYPKFP